jgi:phage protein D/phage baseplate assembly protein gpV
MSDVRTEATGTPGIDLEGMPIEAAVIDKLLDVRVELGLCAPAQATLRFFDADFKLCDRQLFRVAKAIEIKFPGLDANVTNVFTGDIVAVGVDVGADDLAELVITAYDRSHRLSRQTTSATFLRQSYRDMISTLARRHGLRSDVQSGKLTTELAYFLQTTDDLSWLTEVTRRTGTQWRVDGQTLKVFAPPLAGDGPTVVYGEDLLRWRTRVTGLERNDQVQVRGWDPMAKQTIVSTSNANPAYLSTAALATSGRSAARQFGSARRETGTTVLTSTEEANEVANAYRSRSTSVEVRARGETFGRPDIVPGKMITVNGVGSLMSGKYYVSAVEHVYNTRGHVTRFTAGTLSPDSLADLVGGTAAGAAGGMRGPMIGIVTNINDPDGIGRVKVKLPVLGDDTESDWARLAMPGAGPQRGLMLLPSINDEVLVLFEQGDPRRPLIVGAVWNGKDKPPIAVSSAQRSGKVKRWGLKTVSGHTLTFIDDDAASGRLEIVLVDGKNKIVLGKQRIEVFADNTDIELKSGQAQVLLSNGQDVVIKGVKVSIEAQTELKLGGVSVTANAKSKLALGSNGIGELKATGTLSVSAGGITEVKGTLVKIN